MGVKMTLTFNEETMETLRKKARDEGFGRPSLLARYLMIRGLKEDVQAEINEDSKAVLVKIDNFSVLLMLNLPFFRQANKVY